MTKKDYILIADALYSAGRHLQKIFTVEEIAAIAKEYEKQMKKFLALDNPKFDEYKFTNYISGILR